MNHCAVTGLVSAATLLGVWACGGSQPEAAAPERRTAVAQAPAPAPAPASSAGGQAGGSAGGADTRSTDVIQALVKAHRSETRACYEKAREQIPGLQGDVTITFVLKPSGKLKHAELNEARSTIREATLASCLIDVISAIEFPPSSKGRMTTANYPFNFTP
jgi:hypothetical protein